MARTHAECEEMLRVSQETGMPLWVAYYRRALPAFLEAKRMVEAGEIGQPLSVRVTLHWPAKERRLPLDEMNWRVKPEISGAGHFFDLASHQFDYLDFVLGAVTSVKGIAANLAGLYPAEDTVSASWQHASGVIGSGSWSFTADGGPEEDSIEIVGDKGAVQLSCFAEPDILLLKSKQGKSEQRFVNPDNISLYLVQQVVDDLRGVGACVSTGESAARTNRVLEDIIRNYYSYKT
jgi:predicted dehydrogenase